MTSVFVSHASQDKATVCAIIGAIEAQGLETWVSFRDLQGGSEFDSEIGQALSGASAVVAVCSKSSMESKEVRAEIREAFNQHKTVIPVKIDDCVLPWRLGSIQYIIWDDENRTKAICKLKRALPEAAATQLETYLARVGELENLRRLIKAHLEWLPVEYLVRTDYNIKFDARISGYLCGSNELRRCTCLFVLSR